MANNCITPTLIGVSKLPCDCFTEELNDITPVDASWYNKSTSGLYLDQLESEGLISMRAADGSLVCDKTLGTFYKDAIAEAIARTIDDAYTAINERFKSKRDSYSGKIGGNKFNKLWPIPNAVIAGVLLTPRDFVDGVFKLNRITIGSNVTSTDVTVSIFRFLPNLEEFEPELVINIEDITTVAGRSTITTLEEPIILPMEVDGEQVQYLIVRSIEPNEPLPNTSPSCGCGKKEFLFNQYATFQGITINDDAESFADFNVSGYTHGISLDGEFMCDSEAIICRMFAKDAGFKKVFAYAVLYLAGAIVNRRVILSPDISRWNMVNFDDIKSIAANFMGEYESRLIWLSQNTDPSVNECYQCGNKNALQMSKTIIRGNG